MGGDEGGQGNAGGDGGGGGNGGKWGHATPGRPLKRTGCGRARAEHRREFAPQRPARHAHPRCDDVLRCPRAHLKWTHLTLNMIFRCWPMREKGGGGGADRGEPGGGGAERTREGARERGSEGGSETETETER